jgi:hypothetical protein
VTVFHVTYVDHEGFGNVRRLGVSFGATPGKAFGDTLIRASDITLFVLMSRKWIVYLVYG